MSKRGKIERRDLERAEEGPKTPTKTPTKRKSNVLRSSKKPKDVASARWGKKKNSNRGRFGSQGRNYAQKSRKEDIETSEIKPSRYVTPQKKKRDESISTSNQTTSSEKVAPPRKRVNWEI